MADRKNLKHFPDLSKKLTAPTTQSTFERSKAEAEAKRLRQEAEDAAALEAFKESFGADDGPPQPSLADSGRQGGFGIGALGPGGRSGLGSGPGKRHFTAATERRSGPGTLGPLPQQQPTSNTGKKRAWDDGPALERSSGQSRLNFDDEDDEDEDDPPPKRSGLQSLQRLQESSGDQSKAADRAVSRPTLKLQYLPLSMTEESIRTTLPSKLRVHLVRFMPFDSHLSTERKSKTAIVELSSDTPGTDMNEAVTKLQDKYLGEGFRLSIQRHLSSAVLGSSSSSTYTNPSAATGSLPFGAKAPPQPAPPQPQSAPRGRGGGRFVPPPASYHSRPVPSIPARVVVSPPTDIRELRLIHKTIEQVVHHGPEVEALLMAQPAVKQQQKWAWLWDARSQAGVYYRWRLWSALGDFPAVSRKAADRSGMDRDTGSQIRLFRDTHDWVPLESQLPFEFCSEFDRLIEDSAYDSSDEDDSDDESGVPKSLRRKLQMQKEAGAPSNLTDLSAIGEKTGFLNPLQRAKLMHLLSRMPNTTGTVRKGDVARITSFAISHAAGGAEEIVEILTANILRPFNLSNKNSLREEPEDDDAMDMDAGDKATGGDEKVRDKSSAIQVALYIVSDLLFACSAVGINRSWRYRQLLEAALQKHQVFGKLGRLNRDLGWGRLRTDKWERSMEQLLTQWRSRSLFSEDSHTELMHQFKNPPLTAAEERFERQEKARKKEADRARLKEAQRKKGPVVNMKPLGSLEGVGEPTTADQPSGDEVIEGAEDDVEMNTEEPAAESVRDEAQPKTETPDESAKEDSSKGAAAGAAAPAPANINNGDGDGNDDPQPPRRRMRAEDMFADSDGEG